MEAMPEDMWTSYKNLNKIVNQALAQPSSTSLTDLELCLRKYKQNFASILKNPTRNERNRAVLLAGLKEGFVTVKSNNRIMLSKDLVDETLIISDMYDLNEFIALQLLCTAQRQLIKHPGLSRGLVAILLYYDGRKAIASTLRDLFQVTSGFSWETDVQKEVTSLITSFTQSLVKDTNILWKILDSIIGLDISKETVLLTKNRAFGPNKQKNQVLELFEDTRLALATSLYNWSAQRGLPSNIIIKLIDILSNYTSLEASGSIDDVMMTMLMALLYSYDTSVLQRRVDNILVQNLNIINEIGAAQQIHNAIYQVEKKNGLNSLTMLTFGLALANLRHIPQNLQPFISKVIDYDEQLVDDAISKNVFEFMYYQILEVGILYKNEFFYRRMHRILTDFIEYMHSKVSELRGRADDTARTVISFMKEGIEPPQNLDNNFEMLMRCIGKFYKKNRAGLSLCVEFWGVEMKPNCLRSTTRAVSLFKFLRLAGELLPTTLFVPYLKMIAGLTSCERSARNAFNLLKQTGLSGSMTLSWEHFFGSLARYYSNLRQEQYPVTDTIYKKRFLNKSINPEEIEGLHAVLEVIRSVAIYDEIARIAICEHPNWAPLHILIGLMSCSVPLMLKADIINTLAALANCKETAATLWNNMEDAQIIPTIPTTSAYNMCNLQVEIEQNECRLEIYPLTQSILDLLYTLIKMGIPNNLGSGSRKPGMEPYLTFIVNEIFLKFNTRNYKNTIEKWQIAEKCLKILRYLLEIYEIHNQDLVKNKTDQLPGYHIMLQLHTKSEMLHLILLIIDETRLKLDEYTKFNEKNDLEECGLHCLKILKLGLEKQDSFFEYHSTTNNTILLSGLKNILLDVNPRSGNPDHILNTTKFVTYNWLPKHRYNAIKILKIISKQPKVTHQILDMLTENIQIQTEIRNGFMECLEHDITLPLQYSEMESISANQALKKELELKESVIDFLQEGLYQPAPNLTHFLLGFDTSKDFNQTQKMRVIDVSCNCLKSIISLLDSYLEVQDKAYDNNFERFIERCYYFIYSLCANQKTSETILRYLRSCGDFMSRHICAFPFSYMKEPHILRQMSYVLKCIAIELKVTSSNCQISRFQYLCELLVSTDKNGYHNNIPMDINNLCPQSSNLLTDKFICKQQSEKSLNLILCNLLDMISFEVVNHSIPRLEFFDGSLISQILHDCEIENEEGLKQISIKKLDQLLHDELRTVQTTIATGQRKHILNEIKVLLYFALQINNGRCKSFATIKFIEAWCQVTEILFSCAPELALSINTKQELILEILQKLLSKIVPIQPIFEVSILTSGTMLLLLVNLRYNYQTLRRIVAEKDNTPKNRLDTLEDEHKTMSTKSNSLSLKFILKNILEWIIISGGASQKLRINLYASLLNYLRIIKGCHNRNSKEDITNEIYILGLDKSIVKDVPHNESALIQLTVEIFLSFGEKLIDIICSDCITGHDICKMTALSCIDGLLELGSMSDFITFFAKRGYLAHLIESLLKSDDNLCLVLKKSPKNIKSLYVYESKMSMLLRLASCHMGAELLLTEKVLHVLSNMKVYDMYPDFQNRNDLMEDNDLNDFIPSIDMRYRHILFPALNFCECIISTLGKKNHSAISQVTHFLLAHCGMVETVLRSGTPFMQLEPLQEYAAITGLVARTINQNIFSLSEIHATEHSDINLYRTHKLMLSSLSQFLVNENTFKEMLRLQYIKGPINDATKDKYIKTFFEIAANLSLFCCNAISDHSTDRRINGIMFLETIQSNDNLNNSNKIIHYLNVIIDQLKSSVEFVYNQNYTADNLLCQKAVPQDINGDELVTHKYVKSFFNMNQCLCTTRDALSLCVFVTEQCLYLLWSHLDFYVRKTFSNDFEHKLLLDIHQQTTCSDDIGHLKKSLISTFNETFCKHILWTCESCAQVEKGFNEALLRRIKSLIQFA